MKAERKDEQHEFKDSESKVGRLQKALQVDEWSD
jgi:hypothetical protein